MNNAKWGSFRRWLGRALGLVITGETGQPGEAATVARHPNVATGLALILTGVLCIPLFGTMLSNCHVYPNSDEWHYLAPVTAGQWPSPSWLFAQAVDHRIPIQKLTYYCALKASDFDFRAPIGVNIVVAAITAALFVLAARIYRGRGSFGDLFIPLCILNLAPGYLQWGFHFQFLSSILFTSAFTFFAAIYSRTESSASLVAAFASLFLCAWCGLNGAIPSTLASFAIAGFLLVRRVRISQAAWWTLGATLCSNAAIWMLWTPTDTSQSRASLAELNAFIFGMVDSPLIVFAFTHPVAKFAFLMTLIGAGGLAAVYHLASRRSLASGLMLAIFVAGAGIIPLTAYGRASASKWGPGLEMHYGCLAMLVLIVAWMCASASFHRRIVAVAGIALVGMFVAAYQANYEWRMGYIETDRQSRTEILQAIAGDEDPQTVAAAHINQLFCVDSPGTREVVAAGIKILREHSHYAPERVASRPAKPLKVDDRAKQASISPSDQRR